MEESIIENKETKTILSNKYNDFVTIDSSKLPSRLDLKTSEVPEIFKNYEYPVSSWPVIIDKDKASKLNQLSVKLPKLLEAIPSLYFSDNTKELSDFYFGGNEMITQFALMCHHKNVAISCRLDLTYTEEGFKILEANMGSSIGGWQVQSFEFVIRGMHFELSKPDSFIVRDTQSIYIEFLVNETLKKVAAIDKEVNIFLCLKKSLGDELKKNSITFFNELLKTALRKKGLTGQAFSGNVSSLKLADGKLRFQQKEVHCVVVLSLESSNEIPPDVFRAFITNKIYFPDHLGVSMLGDKRNLALLRELAEKCKFNKEDNELILKSIPWTSLVRKGDIMFKGMAYDFLVLLREMKDQLVIKAANGFQGKDVFVGKFSTVEEWENAIHLAMTHKNDFIVQEFSESIDFLAPNIDNHWVAHKLIWGSFGFGDHYGGVWVRMSEVLTDVGIINSATGAVEAIVYENIS